MQYSNTRFGAASSDPSRDGRCEFDFGKFWHLTSAGSWVLELVLHCFVTG
jgi:hypothetical protein